MDELLQQLGSKLNGDTLETLSMRIGSDTATTQRAVGIALPILIAALAKNATSSPQGAASLSRALDRDHDGSLLDGLGSLLGGSQGAGGLGAMLGGGQSGQGGGLGDLLGMATSMLGSSGKSIDGAGILRHILGSRQGGVVDGISRASGLDSAQVMQLLVVLGPIVMSALGKMKKKQDLDQDGLSEALDRQRSRIDAASPQGGLFDMLDRDNDGQIADDIASLGAGLAGAFMKAQRKGQA